jgi:hypothetical protein
MAASRGEAERGGYQRRPLRTSSEKRQHLREYGLAQRRSMTRATERGDRAGHAIQRDLAQEPPSGRRS